MSQITEVESRWRDWIFTNIQPKGYVFFSSLFMNESKYFVIYGDGGYIRISRFDQYGTLEDTRSYHYGGSLMVGNSVNLNWGEIILSPVVIYDSAYTTPEQQHQLGLLIWNVTDYLAGNSGLTIEKFTPISSYSPSRVYDYISISNVMSKGAYPSGIVDNNQTVAMTYYDVVDGKFYVVWDFYDLENYQFTISKLKRANWDTGLSDIKRVYVYATQGNCFQYTDCVFHIIFEGRSSQNNNRYGIYVREGRKGAFGWDWTDKGLIGFETSIGFQTQTSGIDYWTFQHHYPFLDNKIYFRAIQNGKRIVAWVKFTPTWTYLYEGSLNVYSNAFTYSSQNLNGSTASVFIPSQSITCTGLNYTLNMYNLTDMHDYLYLTVHGKVASHEYEATYVYQRVTIVDAFNSTASVTYEDYWSWDTLVSGYEGRGITRHQLPDGSGVYNVTVEIAYYYPPSDCLSDVGTVVANDIFADTSSYTLGGWEFETNPFFFVTSDVQGDIEAFSLYSDGGDIIYIRNTDKFGIQTVSYACRCTDWVSQGCYNSTHELWTRTCSPPACSDESMFYYNDACSVVYPTTTTVTVVPQVPLLNTSEFAELYNITDPKILAFMSMISLFTTPIFIATVILISIVAYVAYKAGKVPSVITGIILLIIYTLLGIYPVWVGIILVIIAGFILTIIFREAF